MVTGFLDSGAFHPVVVFVAFAILFVAWLLALADLFNTVGALRTSVLGLLLLLPPAAFALGALTVLNDDDLTRASVLYGGALLFAVTAFIIAIPVGALLLFGPRATPMRPGRAQSAAGTADPDAQWDLVYRPRSILRIVAVAILIVLAIHITFGLLLNISYTGVNIGWGDQLALIGVGVVISCALLLFTRSRLRVGPAGVGVRNLVTERFYRWDAVQGLSYPEKGQWAWLLFAQDEHIPVMAVQARDGNAAIDAMRTFRELQSRYTGPVGVGGRG